MKRALLIAAMIAGALFPGAVSVNAQNIPFAFFGVAAGGGGGDEETETLLYGFENNPEDSWWFMAQGSETLTRDTSHVTQGTYSWKLGMTPASDQGDLLWSEYVPSGPSAIKFDYTIESNCHLRTLITDEEGYTTISDTTAYAGTGTYNLSLPPGTGVISVAFSYGGVSCNIWIDNLRAVSSGGGVTFPVMVEDFESAPLNGWTKIGSYNPVRGTTSVTQGTYTWSFPSDSTDGSSLQKTVAIPSDATALNLDYTNSAANCWARVGLYSPYIFADKIGSGTGTLAFAVKGWAGTNQDFVVGSDTTNSSGCTSYFDNLRFETGGDTVPNALDWEKTGTCTAVSNTLTVTGIDTPITIQVTTSRDVSRYNLNGTGWVNFTQGAPGYINVKNGDTLQFGTLSGLNTTVTVINYGEGTAMDTMSFPMSAC